MNIRKLLLITPMIATLLTGCNNRKISIVVPTGAPAVAFYNFDSIETNSDPSNIIPMMVNNTVDIAVLPTNAGVQAITNKHINYKIAATITFGNIFIASTGNDDDGIMNEGDYIVSFQQNAVPDKIFHYCYGNTFDSSIHYLQSAQEAAKALKSGIDLSNNSAKVDYVVLAEPALYTVLNTTPGRSVYANLQEVYKVKSGNMEMFQASVFVSNYLSRDKIDNTLEKLQNDIEAGLENPDLIKNKLIEKSNSQITYGVDPEIAKKVTENNNGMGLGFKLARENKMAINLFLSLFGIGETNEEIFY